MQDGCRTATEAIGHARHALHALEADISILG
jgi:hypothetical protein